jgi:hypothetical protein
VLLGAAEAMRQASEGPVYHYYLPDDALRERTRLQVEATLGTKDFSAAWDAGTCMDLDSAVATARMDGAVETATVDAVTRCV